MSDYETFLKTKQIYLASSGITVSPDDVHPKLFPFQRDLTCWAVRKGRAALFADTGLGKTFMQLEWARLIGQPTLIVAPLSVARQTAREADKIGLAVPYVREQEKITTQISITNYEMVEYFDPSWFGAVVLDESSILKSFDGKTKTALVEMFQDTPYRLCCTATPAPNDISEIANHAEFLGIMSRADMLATFFVHDDEGWRLKKHARQPFYRWLASWGMSIRKPSDLGYDDGGYNLPELFVEPVWVKTDFVPEGQLLFTGLKGIGDRSRVRQGTLEARCAAAAEFVNTTPGQWIVWTGLNEESSLMCKLVPDAEEVTGADSIDKKVETLERFQDGGLRVLVTKPKIAGHGLNMQNCHQMAFVGLSDSWEAYYQCIRRCYRFGQKLPVSAYVVLADAEQEIYQNVQRKEEEAKRMADNLIQNVREFERQEIGARPAEFVYKTDMAQGENWKLMLGDSSERLAEIADNSVGLSIYSPPFLSLYTYSATERDLGNSCTPDEFYKHYNYIIAHLLRVTKPGRNTCCHVAQVPAMLARDGYIGMKDFRGQTIQAYEAAGWVYHGEVCIDKDPQAQAIRTHSKGLLFTQLRKDSSWLRPAMADYILVFRKPGDNAEPIKPDITNEEWIEWARPIWFGIKESDTLQYTSARDGDDERHVAPLQLGTIERCVRLWSNRGDTVLSPFAGIGSEGYVSLKNGRKFIGCELKPSYWHVAVKNLETVVNAAQDLFAYAASQ